MHLEGLLSELKQTTRAATGKFCIAAESLVSLCYCSKLMRTHVQSGRQDCTGLDQREQMVANGVPVIRAYRAAQANGASASARSSRSSGSSTLATESLFDCGDDVFPVREDVVRQFVEQHVSTRSLACAGLRNKAVQVRKACLNDLIVREDTEAIPEARQYRHRFSCSELHPGLCAAADADVYHDSKLLAKSFERFMTESLVSSYIAMNSRVKKPEQVAGRPENEEPQERPPECMFIYLARVKARRFHSQVTHVLVRCVPHSQPTSSSPIPVLHLSLGQCEYRCWEFMTLWSLAKELLQKQCEVVHLKVLQVTEHPSDGTVALSASDLDLLGDEIWPTLYVKPRAAAQGDDLQIPGDVPKPPRRRAKATGGIKAMGHGLSFVCVLFLCVPATLAVCLFEKLPAQRSYAFCSLRGLVSCNQHSRGQVRTDTVQWVSPLRLLALPSV
jgi:hypothetical protein